MIEENDHSVKIPLQSRILTIRGVQVMLDRDLAELYGVETKVLNQAVKRNIDRFPSYYRFQLTRDETNEVVTICDHLSALKFSSNPSYAFTESGVAMLSSVLHSREAVQVSIQIIDAFVAMRHFLQSNAQVFTRLDRIEYKLLESDHKFEEIYSKLEEKSLKPTQGLFFDGQIYDAYEFLCGLIRQAARRIVLIDNYIDETVLTMLDKRGKGVDATIYTQSISPQLTLDIAKHNAQYPSIEVSIFKQSHDRFLVIDDKLYLVGASLKDLGKNTFFFTQEDFTLEEVLKESQKIQDALSSSPTSKT